MLKKTNKVKTHTYEAGEYKDANGFTSKWYVDIREDELNGSPCWDVAYRVRGIGFTYEPWGLAKTDDMTLDRVLEIVERNMDADKALYEEELEFSEWCNETFCFDLPNKIANPIVFDNDCPCCGRDEG